MRNTMANVCIVLEFPYVNPDANGILYTRDAIKKAIRKGVSNLPIIYIDNDGYEKVIGSTNDERVVPEWDETDGVCRVKVNGVVFSAGTSCIVNKLTDRTVEDFDIRSIGLSV